MTDAPMNPLVAWGLTFFMAWFIIVFIPGAAIRWALAAVTIIPAIIAIFVFL